MYIQFRPYSAFKGRVIAQAVSRQPFTLENQVRCQARLGEACDELSKAGTSFFQCTSVCCCQRHAPTLLSSEDKGRDAGAPSKSTAPLQIGKTGQKCTSLVVTQRSGSICRNFTRHFQSRPLSLV